MQRGPKERRWVGAAARPPSRLLQVWSDFHHDFLARWRADIEGAAKRRVDLIKARGEGGGGGSGLVVQ